MVSAHFCGYDLPLLAITVNHCDMRRPYPNGIDCVWLASDRVGQVAAFITAGLAPIPAAALDSAYLPIEDVEERLCRLPTISRAQLLVCVKRPDSFIDLAERGLFVYDWTDVHRMKNNESRIYERVAMPTEPIDASSLPSDLMALAISLRDTEFSAGAIVNIYRHFNDVEELVGRISEA